MKKPNIILFMVDQLTASALSMYGGSVCKTPNLDAFASRSTVFSNMYCNYPLCAPSRFSMMSGRLPSRIGAYDNGAEFAASTPTFAHYLRLYDYYTCISGKMHFVGPDQYHGFEERLTTEIYPADMSWTPAAKFRDIRLDGERPYTSGISTIDTVTDSGPVARSMQIDYDEDVIHHATRELFSRARSDDTRPYMMTVSLTHPHDPYVITKEYWDLYSDNEIDPPKVEFVPLEDRDPHSRALYHHFGQDKCEISQQHYRNARRGYYGMISYVDTLFGRLIDAIEGSGFTEDTVILFASDHGDMIGERGMWFKKTLFEPAIRVPLIIHDPKGTAGIVDAPVSLLDIFPTMLEIAGIPAEQVAGSLDGRSLLPAMRGEALAGQVLIEHLDGGTDAPRVAVRDGDWKLVYSKAYPTQLYNLAEDPDEQKDLAGTDHPDEVRLTEIVKRTWDLDQLAEDVVEAQTERKLIDTALGKGRREIWDFAPRPLTQNTNYVRRGDEFPTVEQRGYLYYIDERKTS